MLPQAKRRLEGAIVSMLNPHRPTKAELLSAKEL
jgi:hypothetical protein